MGKVCMNVVDGRYISAGLWERQRGCYGLIERNHILAPEQYERFFLPIRSFSSGFNEKGLRYLTELEISLYQLTYKKPEAYYRASDIFRENASEVFKLMGYLVLTVNNRKKELKTTLQEYFNLYRLQEPAKFDADFEALKANDPLFFAYAQKAKK